MLPPSLTLSPLEAVVAAGAVGLDYHDASFPLLLHKADIINFADSPYMFETASMLSCEINALLGDFWLEECPDGALLLLDQAAATLIAAIKEKGPLVLASGSCEGVSVFAAQNMPYSSIADLW